VLGIPEAIEGCLFDLDGVLTQTAKLHDAAWKQTFDEFLRTWAARAGRPFRPFDAVDDYDRYVDGRPRLDGVRTFLASRGIELPPGHADDAPGAETIVGLGAAKDAIVMRMARENGVEAYEGSVRYVRAVREAGLRRAVVSASAHCREFLAAAGIAELFEVVVDGNDRLREQLQGKPAPDTFLFAARELDLEPVRAAVFEDALAGVEAGRAGGFGYVVGVDRVGQAEELRAHGADRVVSDLAELLEAG